MHEMTKYLAPSLSLSLLALSACAAPMGDAAPDGVAADALCTHEMIASWDRCGDPPAACGVVDVMLDDYDALPEISDPTPLVAALERDWPEGAEAPAHLAGLELTRDEYLDAVDLLAATASHEAIPPGVGACKASAPTNGGGPIQPRSCNDLRALFDSYEAILCHYLALALRCERLGCDETTGRVIGSMLNAASNALSAIQTQAQNAHCTFSTTVSCSGS